MKVPGDRRQRLILAAETRTSLRHPHLLPARVARDDRGRVQILLQRQPAPTLSEVLASGPLDLRTSLRLLYGVASAVDALSKAGLVARELTPDRILVSPRRGGILADSGIPLDLLPPDTSPDDPAAAYRSPEELAGLPIDARSNVYSLGAVFLATLTAPDGERLALPAPANAVVGRAMANEPDKRYANPREFIVTMTSASGLRRRAGKDGKRSPPAAPEREAAAVTDRSRPPGPSASARAVGLPKSGKAPPAPAHGESPETRPRPLPDEGESRPAPVRGGPTIDALPMVRPGAAAHQSVSTRHKPAQTTRRSEARPPLPSPAAVRTRPERRVGSPRRETPHSRPRLRVPTLPRLTVPSMPRLSVPSLPRLSVPSLPRLSVPSLPRLQAPSLARGRAPGATGLRATAKSRLSLPTLPRLRVPDIARLQAPARIGAAATLFGLAVIGFFLVGMLLGRHTGDEPQPAPIERSSFAVELPSGWGETKVASAGAIELSAPVAAAPRGEGGAGLVVARVPDIVMLDRRFRAELGAQGQRTEIRLGRLQAWRYAGLRTKRGLVATAYLAPTTGNPLLFICHATPSDARARLAECEDIGSTVALRGERPASLAAVTRHKEQLVSVMASLRRERLRGRRQLAEVELAADQAVAARDLERTYKEAASHLARGEPPAGTTNIDDLVGSLRLTASAYGELAEAAADADEAGFRAASKAVLEGEEAVRRDAVDPKPA